MTQPVLRINNLTVRLRTAAGVVHAVSDVSLDIARGEFVGVVGESGCGKSTLALAMLRLLDYNATVSGSVHIEDVAVLDATDRELRQLRGGRVGFVPQDPLSSLDPTFSVGEQIAETIRAHDRSMSRRQARERATDLMARVGIDQAARRYRDAPHTLSGGMRQRIAIAAAVANQPSLIIADEPTTSLDVTVQRQILELLIGLADDIGTAICLITHDLSVVSDVCDRVTVLYAGRVVEQGPVGQILRRPQHPYTHALLRSTPSPAATRVRLAVIPGEVPDPTAMPPGCSFSPRCASRLSRCEQVPPLTEVEPDWRVACWLGRASDPTPVAVGHSGRGGDDADVGGRQ